MSRISPLLVRLLLLAAAFTLLLSGARAADPRPDIPDNRIYDPDFLLTREGTRELAAALDKFHTQTGWTIYLAVFGTPSRLMAETAQDLNEAWNQSGFGVVVTFLPRSADVRVLPSPQLSLVTGGESLGAVFRGATRRGVARGDYSLAAKDGAAALMKDLTALRTQTTNQPKTSRRPSRLWLLILAAAIALGGLGFLWRAVRVWMSANLFDHSYRFPVPNEPVPQRFGAPRCGGLMAAIIFREGSKAEDV
ncbi:MAG: hypothetical protein H0X40_02295 [Chthoniobacterales bacterium]|nr:hypothetical protein [Chthoniobacterales bacterium]